ALIAIGVLALTALLVNTVPARSALAQPFTAELHTGDVLIDVTVDPAQAGPVDIHTYTLTHAGAVTDVEELTIALTLPGRDIGPLDVPLQRAGPGHFAAYDFDVPIPGVWQLDVTARTSDIHQDTATTTVRIR
ncbi:MAG: copper resistance protein CopC, partial [Acidimicrobiales bacterium]